MKITYFPNQLALNSTPVIDAFLEGCKNIELTVDQNNMSADIAVIWSLVWAGRMRPNQQVYQEFLSTGRPVILLEVGMISRGHTWRLALINDGKILYAKPVESHRPQKLGLSLKPWKQDGQHIVIATQRTDSEQWAGQPDISTWLSNTVDTIKTYSDRPIVIRPHPRQKVVVPAGCTVDMPRPIVGTYDSFNFDASLKNAWAVVNWNSSPGIHAVVNGVPAFVSETSLARPVANLSLSEIEDPIRPDRTSWLNNLAHTEWTLEEIASGVPLSQLLGLIS